MLALLSLLLFYAVLGIAPGPGRQDIIWQDMVLQVTGFLTIDSLLTGEYDAFWDALAHMTQPVLILAYFSMAYITRMTRTFMLNVLSGEFVITARAKGLSSRLVIWRHAFPTVALQLVLALFAPLLSDGEPAAQHLENRLAAPHQLHTGWAPMNWAAMSGPALSMVAGPRSVWVISVVVLTSPLGLLIGCVAGYCGNVCRPDCRTAECRRAASGAPSLYPGASGLPSLRHPRARLTVLQRDAAWHGKEAE